MNVQEKQPCVLFCSILSLILKSMSVVVNDAVARSRIVDSLHSAISSYVKHNMDREHDMKVLH